MKYIEIATITSSIGLSVLLVDVLSIGQRFKKLFKINPLKQIKPFDCLTCMTFWSSIIFSYIYPQSLLEAITNILATLLIVVILQNKNVL